MCLCPSWASDSLGTPGKSRPLNRRLTPGTVERGRRMKHGQSCNKGRCWERLTMGPPGVERKAEETLLGRSGWRKPPRRWMECSEGEAALDKWNREDQDQPRVVPGLRGKAMHVLQKVPQAVSLVLHLKNHRALKSWAAGLSCRLPSHGEVVRVADACATVLPDSLREVMIPRSMGARQRACLQRSRLRQWRRRKAVSVFKVRGFQVSFSVSL